MKKTQNNYRARYGDAIRSLGCNDEEFESLKDINTELEIQLEREKKSVSDYPEFYKLSDIMRSIGLGGGIVVNAPVQVVKELNDNEIARVGGKLTDIVGREFARRTGGAL